MSERPADEGAALVRLVADLLAQLEGTAVAECEFRSGAHHVLVRRAPAAVAVPANPAAGDEAIPATWQGIVAPLTGIFYAAESPQNPPFVVVGATVMPGQPVGLIESMKMFNPVESEIEGVVRSVLVQNGAVVEKGQALMYVEPRGDRP